MRGIEFIAPVAYMRGNLSGEKKLTYPTKNNDAWDAPDDKKSYATNYTPRYIGAKRSATGKSIFSVKQRSAVNMTSAVRMQQALLGASVSLSSSMVKQLTILPSLQSAYARAVNNGLTTKTFTKWVQEQSAIYLENKSDIFFNLDNSVFIVENPFIGSHESGAVSITGVNSAILVKFWGQLSLNGSSFTVAGQKGVCFVGENFIDLIASNHNILGLSRSDTQVEGMYPVKKGDLFLVFEDDGTIYSAVTDRDIRHQMSAAGTSTGKVTDTYILQPTAGTIWDD